MITGLSGLTGLAIFCEGDGVDTLSIYAAGTAYSFTNAPAALDFGTTDPVLTITKTGTWLLLGRINVKYNAATLDAARTLTTKLRRTNNTAGDVAGSSTATVAGVVTTFTGTFAIIDLPPVLYTTSNTDDAITIFGGLSALPTDGTLDATEASIVALKVA